MRSILFIVSSPSGGGKTTLVHEVRKRLAGWGQETYFSVSHTTRAPRPGEIDGHDYHFVSRTLFEGMVHRGEFLEWAEYAGHLYGTARHEVEGRLGEGIDVFLDIDVQGAQQIKTSIPEAVKIFIYPPSYAELKRRLTTRRQDPPEAIERRLKWALRELGVAGEFDYAIINDRLERAVEAMFGVCVAEHHRLWRMRPHLEKIRGTFQESLEKDFSA
jgi:guanylate kinase